MCWGFLKKSGEFVHDLTFSRNAHGLVAFGSTLEIDQAGNAANAKFRGNAGGVVHIDFGDGKFTGIFHGDFVHHWAKHAAGSAPWGPEVHQHGRGGIFDEGMEVGIVEFGDVLVCHKMNL
jgi:hypothetical protein